MNRYNQCTGCGGECRYCPESNSDIERTEIVWRGETGYLRVFYHDGSILDFSKEG